MLRIFGKSTIQRVFSKPLVRHSSAGAPSKKSSGGPAPIPQVPGLSEKCVKVPSSAVGPGASKDSEYKNPEYFCYNVDSFAEAEVEMAKYRLPAPSNKKKFIQK